jgi:hypothetical protein
MPLKALVATLAKAPVTTLSTAATTLGTSGDTSMANTNLQVVTVEQLQEIVD